MSKTNSTSQQPPRTSESLQNSSPHNKQWAEATKAKVTLMTADSADVDSLVRQTAQASVTSGEEDGTRWAETGWWLVPLLALFSLSAFRRVRNENAGEVDA